MEEKILIKKIRTSRGDGVIDYEALANLPNIPAVSDVNQLLTDVDQLKDQVRSDSATLHAHVENTNNPHQVGAHQVSINDELAAGLDLHTPAFTEDALTSLLGEVNNIYDMLYGTGSKYRWRTYAWNTYPSSASIVSRYFDLQVADSFAQNPSTGELTLANPTTITRTDKLPEEGKYFIAKAEHSATWTTGYIYQVTSNSVCNYYGNIVSEDPLVIDHYVQFEGLTKLSPYEKYLGDVTNDAADAYKENEWRDNIHYIKDDLTSISVAKMETGSYIGTGTFGTYTPTSIVLNFEPKILIIDGCEVTNKTLSATNEYGYTIEESVHNVTDAKGRRLIYVVGGEYAKCEGYGVYYTLPYDYSLEEYYLKSDEFDIGKYYVKTTYDTSTKTISIVDDDAKVNTNAQYQLNVKGVTYRYVAIG